MALVVKDRVQETTTTSGTGTLTLAGAIAGYQAFSSAIGNSNTTFYTIYDNIAQVWEVGIGTVGPSTLARTTVLSNSSGTTSPISLPGNAAAVFCTYPAEQSINYDANGVATIGSTLSYSDTGIIGSFASTVAGYNQVIIQNKSNATNASSNINVSNDTSTSSAGYAELGINSSTFTGTGSFNLPNASYLASASTDLTIGTYGAYNVHFVTNSNATDAMTIFNSGGVSLGGYGDPGIGTLYANNVYVGFNTITAAAGTTILTNASAGWQSVVGTNTQTIQLPVATTLFKGFAFTVTSSSTGAVTIKDNASATIDTVVTGGSAILVLTNNSTSAGTWVAYSYIPASYDFSVTTANFGGAAITNALWNGTTIGTGYGGTGLTTFAAANNAIYSTSSSALAAGTLPIAAGGTAATTFTANGVIYGNGTSALGVTAAGTTGQVLIGNTGAAPSWSTISGSLVSSFQTSLSGLTPSTATTGAVTLAGTLGATSGGTGLGTYTTGDIIYASATNTISKLGIGATNKVLTVAGGIPSWADTQSTMVYPGIGIPNSTGTAWGTSYSTTGSGTVVALATSPTFVTSITAPLHLGGTTASSTLTLQSTSGVGTTDSIALKVGNNGATTGLNISSAGVTTLSSALPVGSGGTGQTSYTDGQLLIGNTTGNTLTKASLTAGTGISITPGSGSITIATTSTGASITNDTTTATAEYPLFAAATTGSLATVYTSNANYLFTPSTAELQAKEFKATNGIYAYNATVNSSYTIPTGYNALNAGPMIVAGGATVTVSTGSVWTIL